jgi:transglutaminase superfamily protein
VSKMILMLRALWELIRYDVLFRTGGFRRVHRSLNRTRPLASGSSHRQADLDAAMRNALSFYWKPALCLQRSVATARLLRSKGVPAELVIGYRADPFMSHAWVEVGGRVVNDSSEYPLRLQILERL